jgi:hypothetical protein
MFMKVSILRKHGFIGLAIAFFIALAFTAGTSSGARNSPAEELVRSHFRQSPGRFTAMLTGAAHSWIYLSGTNIPQVSGVASW